MNENLKEELNELIPQYAFNKNEFDSYKEICDKENKRIKQIMKELGEKESTAGDYTVKFTVVQRISMNEDKLLNTILSANLSPELQARIIKTKLYVDVAELENAMFNDKIPNNVILSLDKCRNITEVETLKIGRKRG